MLLLIAYTVRDLDRQAGADGYFHVVGRRFTPAGPALATAGAAGTASAVPPGGRRRRRRDRGPAPGRPGGGGATRPTRRPAGRAEPVAERLLLSPAVVKGCRVAMGVTMAFMLIIMI